MGETIGSDRKPRSGVAAAFLGAIFPGLGHGYIGRFRRAALMAIPVVVLVGGALYALSRSSVEVASWLVRPTVLAWVLIANIGIVIWRVAAVADPYRMSEGKHSLGRLAVVIGLAAIVILPHVLIAKYTYEAARLLDDVFVSEGEVITIAPLDETPRKDAPFAPGDNADYTVPDPALTRVAHERSYRNLISRPGFGDPDAVAEAQKYQQSVPVPLSDRLAGEAEGVNRLTILLVGGDGGPGRGGTRADTIIVASFDKTTGKAALFSIPRNMTHVPLPDAWSTAFVDLERRLTPWAERKTWTDDDGDGQPDQFVPCHCFPDQINAIYPFTRSWVDTYPNEVDPGLAALRDTVELLLGIDIDYYAMVNMSGFVRVVDALGGVRVYSTSSVQAEVSPEEEGEEWIQIDISPGWNTLDGRSALAYVRERKSSSDYVRMKRQRCMLKAVVARADVATILRRFPSIARAVGSSVKTDIDIDYLPKLLEYAASLDYDDVATIGFVPPYYTPVVDARGKPTPDLVRIQAMVRWAFSADETTQFETGSESECRV